MINFEYSWKFHKSSMVSAVFYCSDIVSLQSMPTQIDVFMRGNLACDGIIILCDLASLRMPLVDSMIESILKGPDFRYVLKSGLIVINISKAGEAKLARVLKGAGRKLAKYFIDKELGDSLALGGQIIASDCKIIEVAPGSAYFKKPSGDESNEFIRASKALSASENISYISLVIARKIKGNLKGEIKAIFVDSHSIISVGIYLIQRISSNGTDIPLIPIISHNEYSGLKKISLPYNKEAVLFLTSASSSCNMAKDIISTHGVPSRNVMTIYSFHQPIEGLEKGDVAFTLARQKLSVKGKFNQSICIRLGTDNFSPVTNQPRSVMLTREAAPEANFIDVISANDWQKVLSINATSKHHKDSHGIYIDPKCLLESKPVIKWLNETIVPQLPQKTSAIIYDKSSPLAEEFAKLVAKGASVNMVVEYNDYNVSLAKSGDGIICVAPVVASGDTFLSMSRRLRTSKTIHIQYIAGVIIGKSQSQIDKLKNSLRQAANGCSNYVKSFVDLGLGELVISNPWEQEVAFLNGHSDVKARLRLQFINEFSSGNKCRKAFGLGRQSFNDGFVYWPKKYTKSRVNFANVLCTISSALEKCREMAGQNGLFSTDFESAILDPHCFYRFNDSAIQSSLLRSARGSELDYSRSPHESGRMLRLISDQLKNWNEEKGESCYEYILAFLIGKLKLIEKDGGILMNEITDHPEYSWMATDNGLAL